MFYVVSETPQIITDSISFDNSHVTYIWKTPFKTLKEAEAHKSNLEKRSRAISVTIEEIKDK